VNSLTPIDESLELSELFAPPEETPPRAPEPTSFTVFTSIRSRNLRLRLPFGHLLPGVRSLEWVALAAVIFLLWRYGGRQLEVADADRRLVPTASHIAAIEGGFRLDQHAERFQEEREWGGRTKLKYVYDPVARARRA
jgi:hypothetical protein